MMHSKQSQDMLSSCGLRAGSRSLSSGGCSQCHHCLPNGSTVPISNTQRQKNTTVNNLRSALGADMNKKFLTKVKWSPKPRGRAGPGIRSSGVAALKMAHSVACDPQEKVHCDSRGAWMGCCAAHTACWLTLYCGKEKKNLWQLVYLSQQKPEGSLSSGGLPYLPSGIALDPAAIHYHLSKDNFSKTLRDTYHQYLMIKDLLDDTKFSSIIISSDSLMSQPHRSSLSVLGMQWWTKTREISALMGHMHQHGGAGYHPPENKETKSQSRRL